MVPNEKGNRSLFSFLFHSFMKHISSFRALHKCILTSSHSHTHSFSFFSQFITISRLFLSKNKNKTINNTNKLRYLLLSPSFLSQHPNDAHYFQFLCRISALYLVQRLTLASYDSRISSVISLQQHTTEPCLRCVSV